MGEKHTPGPWHQHDMEQYTICGPDHNAIACCEATSRPVLENRANAALIASAPDLAATIERLEAEVGKWQHDALICASNKERDTLHVTIDRQAAQIQRLRGLISETVSHIDGWHDLTTRKKRSAVLDKGNDLLIRLRAALAESESGQPKVTVNLPRDLTHTLVGAEAEQFIIDHGLEDTDPESHINDDVVAPAGG